MKKIIGLSILGIIIVGGLVVAFLPVIVYGGFNVTTVEGTLSFQGSTFIAPQSGNIKQVPFADITWWQLDLENHTQGSYDYFWSKRNVEVDEGDPLVSLEVQITLIINDVNNNTVQEIYFGAFAGAEMNNITVTLGPGEGLKETGYYNIYVKFSLVLVILTDEYSLTLSGGPVQIYIELE